jgi:hypothetical protein
MFAAVLLLTLNLNVVDGIAAISEAHFYVASAGYMVGDFNEGVDRPVPRRAPADRRSWQRPPAGPRFVWRSSRRRCSSALWDRAGTRYFAICRSVPDPVLAAAGAARRRRRTESSSTSRPCTRPGR